jgi:hypothetical protein
LMISSDCRNAHVWTKVGRKVSWVAVFNRFSRF